MEYQKLSNDFENNYRESIQDKQGFWAKQAGHLEWFKVWDSVFDDSHKPFVKWFAGGKINIVQNALDRHLLTERKNKTCSDLGE